ncbi:hypothetical protein RHSIM_Rhsim10G0021400 [Rhododendron simsii]|uniref:PDZ domain-containing protein n=1 Tax=Rhododendron simsii TaxID=118357 RepID=A0A834GF22_RHOSS|nr:hypothetical protein RHSIM_Rhsim10G0021400 [Rhododendron simsii]
MAAPHSSLISPHFSSPTLSLSKTSPKPSLSKPLLLYTNPNNNNRITSLLSASLRTPSSPHNDPLADQRTCAALDSFLVLCASAALSLTLFVADANSASALVVGTPRKLQSDELATVRLFQNNTPSVVYITNLAARQDVFTLDVLEVPQGSGSGFVWDKQGHIVTNYHVIRGASDVKVTLADQTTYDAKIVGYDQDKDVAVLHVDAPRNKLRPMPVGVSADLLVGQKVYAIGNPFGLDHTLTTGVIRYVDRANKVWRNHEMLPKQNWIHVVDLSSITKEETDSHLQVAIDVHVIQWLLRSENGLRREISSAATGRPIQDVIQTDAAINPGNSGGPLLDSSGNLIGINTAIYSPSGASSGVGFSIPVDTVGGIVDQLVKFGKVTRPILGIKFAPDQSVEQLGVSGVLVLDAPPNGPAGKAGLLPTKRDAYGRLILGDIITSVNGKKVTNGSDLYRILDQCKVGEKVIVEVLRDMGIVDIPAIVYNDASKSDSMELLQCVFPCLYKGSLRTCPGKKGSLELHGLLGIFKHNGPKIMCVTLLPSSTSSGNVAKQGDVTVQLVTAGRQEFSLQFAPFGLELKGKSVRIMICR